MKIDEKTKAPDALRIAIEREKNAYDFYKRAAEIMTEPGAKKMFEFLAEEETKHIKLLEDEYNKNILQEM